MDLLGKEGERAAEAAENLSQRLESIESHVNALDSALQDFEDQSNELLEDELAYQMNELRELRKALGDIEREDRDLRGLKKRVSDLEDSQKVFERKLEKFMNSDISQSLEDVSKTLRSTRNTVHNVKSHVKDLEERLQKIEDNIFLEMESRDFDFERKVDRGEFEKREEEMMNEIRKLRASVNFLADSIDEDDNVELQEL